LEVLNVINMYNRREILNFCKVLLSFISSRSCNLVSIDVASQSNFAGEDQVDSLLQKIFHTAQERNFSLYRLWIFIGDLIDNPSRVSMGDFSKRNKRIALVQIKTMIFKAFAKKSSDLLDPRVTQEIWSYSGFEKLGQSTVPLDDIPFMTTEEKGGKEGCLLL
jgi:hypothetical protein